MLGTVLWMWMEPPGTRPAYPQRDQAVLKCRMEDSSFLLSQVFNVLLIIICTVYAVKTRNIPGIVSYQDLLEDEVTLKLNPERTRS